LGSLGGPGFTEGSGADVLAQTNPQGFAPAGGASTHHHKHHKQQQQQQQGSGPYAAAAPAGGALAQAGGPLLKQQLAPSATLATAAKLAAVSAAMYAPKGAANFVQSSYSDCARPHAPRNAFQRNSVDAIANELGIQASAVTLFDLNAPGANQFCHAAAALVGPNSGLAVRDPSRPAVVVAFRGSSNVAAAVADLNFESVPKTVRGRTVEVHRGFWDSVFGAPAPTTCDKAAGAGPVPQSCAAAVAGHIAQLAQSHSLKGPVQVLVTGHSLGAAEAALFALHLDSTPGFDVAAFTFGQPKIGRGKEWRAAYDGSSGLSSRTFRVVHGADPVPMLASRCQTKGVGADYQQVGQLLRVRTPRCPVAATHPKGACLPAVAAGGAECTIEPESAYDDCSIFVAAGKASGKADMCFCGVMPFSLLSKKNGLWQDHEVKLYASHLSACVQGGGLRSVAPGSLPAQGSCSKAYSTADYCSFK
jgi:hypothetical protein